MHRFPLWSLLVCGIALAGCAISTPVSIVGSHAMALRGSLTRNLPDRVALEVTDGTLTCSGSAKIAVVGSGSVAMDVACNDGRKGVADIKTSRHISGHLHLQDGTDAEIVEN